MKPAASRANEGSRTGLRALLATYALLGLGYVILVPLWEPPDESQHYRLIVHLVRGGDWPAAVANRQAHHAPVYYRIASVPLGLLERIDPELVSGAGRRVRSSGWYRHRRTAPEPPTVVGAYVLRGFNLLVGGAAICLIFLGARRIAPAQSAIPLATASLAGLNPCSSTSPRR